MYVVRPRLQGQAEGSGQEGGGGTVVHAANAAKAREIGAERLGLNIMQVEVIETSRGEGSSAAGVFPGHDDSGWTEEEVASLMRGDGTKTDGKWQNPNSKL